MASRRQLLAERALSEPHTRFEHPDPQPLEEALNAPAPETMKELVARYVRTTLMGNTQIAAHDDHDDFSETDPDDMPVTDYQVAAMAEESVEEDNFMSVVDTPTETPPLEAETAREEPVESSMAPIEPEINVPPT